MNIQIYDVGGQPVSQQPVEYVERKGLGHPDSICDAVMEAAAKALRAEYVKRCGRVLHHNLDKALLVAGQSEPHTGGGQVILPMQIIAGDRAANRVGDLTIPIDEIIEGAVLGWVSDNLRLVEGRKHLRFRSEVKPGSAALSGIFDRELPVANDTSAAVGYAPITETERLVLQTEQFINSPEFKEHFPVAGEDVKVMGVRHGREVKLTVAVAMVDRYVADLGEYFDHKEAIGHEVLNHLRSRLADIDRLALDINTLDNRAQGLSGTYLTVLGTSAENGDGGEVGRGNAVNGLISLNRPSSNEAAAGKNTTCHVGNIYNYLTFEIAEAVVSSVSAVQEATVWLCSQIGRPINDPWSTSVALVLEAGIGTDEVNSDISSIVREKLELRATGQ